MTTQLKGLENLQALRLMQQLFGSGESPTTEQREMLLKFSGWGTLRTIFLPKTKWQKEIQAELKRLLTPEQYNLAKNSSLSAFYTSRTVIDGIWEGLYELGFEGGNIGEFGCGTGLFIEHQPSILKNQSRWFGVEKEAISGRIAKLLHPEATIYDNFGLEEVKFPDGMFDLVVGNVPFGDIIPFDPEYNHLQLKIHNYFIAKALDKTKIGGLVVVITSTGTLDVPGNKKIRQYIAERANLLAAIRLPNTAFLESSGTEVTSDILILERTDKPVKQPIWLNSKSIRDYNFTEIYPDLEVNIGNLNFFRANLEEFGVYTPLELPTEASDQNEPNSQRSRSRKEGIASELPLNSYFMRHPDHMLGTPYRDKLYAGERIGVLGDDRPLTEAIANIFKTVSLSFRQSCEGTDIVNVVPPELARVPVFSFVHYEGKLYQRLEYELIPITKGTDQINALLALHEVLCQVIEVQKGNDDKQLFAIRQELNTHYDAFVKQYGYIHSYSNEKLFGSDNRYYLLLALEMPAKECLYSFAALKKSKEHFGKADIFFQRTCKPCVEPTHADSATDALLLSLNYRGLVDINYMAQLANQPSETIIADLSERDEPLIFYDPALQRWVLAEEYLSGLDVRHKLRQAQEAGLEHNVQALTKIQPLYLLPPADLDIRAAIAVRIGVERCNTDILTSFTVEFGASWIPDTVYQAFARQLLKEDNGWSANVWIKYFPSPANSFSVKGDEAVRKSAKNTHQFGTSRKTCLSLLQAGLNLTDPIVYDYIEAVNEEGKTVKKSIKNPEATEEARAMLKTIKKAFDNWLWTDINRAEELTRRYNLQFNCSVVRTYNGSHLELPNSNPDIHLHWYQKNGIWRILQNRGTLLGWRVGAGKTIAMIGAAMELSRLGLATKPMLVCLDSTVEQIEAEFRRMYPAAKLLVSGSKSLSKQTRREFATRIATGHWDAIIVSHSQFFLAIDLSPDNLLQFLNEELEAIRNFIMSAKAEMRYDGQKEQRFSLRGLLSAENRIESHIRKMQIAGAKRKDSVVYLDQLGVSAIFIDEVHYAKNCWKHTKMGQIAGLPNPWSQRGIDTFYKIQWLLQHGGWAVGATGTPVTNTLAEAWTVMRFFMLDQLKLKNLDHFDACASTFFSMLSDSEITHTGKYKTKRRCRRIKNRQEFIKLYRYCVDIIRAEDLDQRNIPTFTEIPVPVPPNPQQESYMSHLSDRAQAVENREVDPQEDNHLAITSDAVKAALDIRLVSPYGENYVDSKLNACVLNAYRIWRDTRTTKATQLVFCDLSTPKELWTQEITDSSFDAYRYLKSAWVALGIPPEQIAFIHDCDRTPDQSKKLRKQLFDSVKAGEVAIVIGSRKKLGTGVNVQEKLIAIHNLNRPWTPAEREQGEGRIVRCGNKHKHVLVLEYLTMGRKNQAGIDAFMFQTIENKAAGIWDTFNYTSAAREVEDIAPTVLSAAQMKAIAIGDPRMKRQEDLKNEIRQIQLQKSAYDQSVFRIKTDIQYKLDSIARSEELLESSRKDLENIQEQDPNSPIIYRGEPLTDKQEAINRIIEDLEFMNILDKPENLEKANFDPNLGSYLGYPLKLVFEYAGSARLWIGTCKLGSGKSLLSEALSVEGLSEIIQDDMHYREKRISDDKTNLETLRSIEGKGFEQQDYLKQLVAELAELDAELNPEKDAAIRREEDAQEEEEEDPFDFWADDKSSARYRGIEPEILLALQEILEEQPHAEWHEDFLKAFNSFDGVIKLDDPVDEPAQEEIPTFAHFFEQEPAQEEIPTFESFFE